MVRLLRRMGARAVQPVAASRPAPNTSCAFGKSDREEPTALKKTARPPRTPLQYCLRIRQDGSVVPGHPAPLGHQMEREINHAADCGKPALRRLLRREDCRRRYTIIEMKQPFRIGVISDTHGRFHEAVVSLFEGVDLIVHAGDVGKAVVIKRLEEIAPVLAVQGNNDTPGLYPNELLERVAGRTILVRHIFGELHQMGKKERDEVERLAPDLVIFGHSHRPYRATLGKTILFNPGSAGPKRFSLPRTVGLLLIKTTSIETRIKHLED